MEGGKFIVEDIYEEKLYILGTSLQSNVEFKPTRNITGEAVNLVLLCAPQIHQLMLVVTVLLVFYFCQTEILDPLRNDLTSKITAQLHCNPAPLEV